MTHSIRNNIITPTVKVLIQLHPATAMNPSDVSTCSLHRHHTTSSQDQCPHKIISYNLHSCRQKHSWRVLKQRRRTSSRKPISLEGENVCGFFDGLYLGWVARERNPGKVSPCRRDGLRNYLCRTSKP